MFRKLKKQSEEVAEDSKCQYHFKIRFVGRRDSGTKTSFIQSYTGSSGSPSYRKVSLRGKKILLELCDGTRDDLKTVDAVVTGYDITDRSSYNKVLRDYRSYPGTDLHVPRMVIGNKLDLYDCRDVSRLDGLVLADMLETPLFYEVSALTGENVKGAMYALVNTLLNSAKEPKEVFLPFRNAVENAPMKILFTGPEKTGTKTSFILRYITGAFNGAPPKRANVTEKTVYVNGVPVELDLVDAPGVEKSFSASSNFKNAAAVIVGYDITSRSSFEQACSACKLIAQKYPNVVMMLIGGMAERISERQVSVDEAKAQAKASNIKLFFEVSSKSGYKVSESMSALITEIIKRNYKIKNIDVSPESPGFSEEIDDDDDDGIASKPGMSFWGSTIPYAWPFEDAVRSKNSPGPETTDNWSRFKVAFVGPAKAGTKTSFIARYTRGEFIENLSGSSTTDFYTQKLTRYGKEMRFTMYDAKSIVSNVYEKACGIVIGYDITNKASFDTLRELYASLWKEYPWAVIMVLGNKLDLGDASRAVSTNEGEALARDLHASLFFEISVKTGEGVYESMEALADIMYRRANKMQACPVLPRADEQQSPAPQSPSLEGDLMLKICFAGPVGTGSKTSFISQYCDHTFDPIVRGTVGVEFKSKNVVSGGRNLTIQMWDSSGLERYDSLLPALFRGANAFVVGYDITHRGGLDEIRRRFSNMKEHGGQNSVIMVIGNKADLEEQREVRREEGEALARELGASLFYETSSKTGMNVNESMEAFLAKILETMEH